MASGRGVTCPQGNPTGPLQDPGALIDHRAELGMSDAEKGRLRGSWECLHLELILGPAIVWSGQGTHSSILAWRIPGTEEPGGLQPMGSQSRTQLRQLSMHACTQYVCEHVHMFCSEALKSLSEQGTPAQRKGSWKMEDTGPGSGTNF